MCITVHTHDEYCMDSQNLKQKNKQQTNTCTLIVK